MNPFLKSIPVYSLKLGFLFVIVILTLTVIPGASSLWYKKLHTNITVKTGDWSHPRSKGYWCHSLSSSLCGCHDNHGNNSAFPTYSQLTSYLRDIGNRSDVFTFNGTDFENVKTAMHILQCCNSGCNSWNHNSMENKLRAQLLAVWLNVVSGYGDGYKLDLGNTTVLTGEEIINMSETALLNHNTPSYESLKNICEEYNTRWE